MLLRRGTIRAYPAHGSVIEDAKAKIEEYIAHRRQREQEAVAVLAGKHGNQDGVVKEEWGSMEMVKIIYKQYPEGLHAPAEGGLLQVLNKLEGEGRVETVEGGKKWRARPEECAVSGCRVGGCVDCVEVAGWERKAAALMWAWRVPWTHASLRYTASCSTPQFRNAVLLSTASSPARMQMTRVLINPTAKSIDSEVCRPSIAPSI